VQAQLEGLAAGAQVRQRALQVVRQRQRRQRRQRRHRRAGGRRIGGIGVDRQRRPLAAQHPLGEVGREDEGKLRLAAGDEVFGIAIGDGGDDFEVAGIFGRAHDAAHERAVVGRHHGGGQMMRVAVDGVAEQHQLHDGHAQHHREGQAVASQLHELLAQYRHDAAPGKAEPTREPTTRRSATGRCRSHAA
jgi:hypothetical protein